MVKCSKIFYNDGNGKSRCIIGVLNSSDDHFMTIKTRSGQVMLNKNSVISIIETKEDFSK
tara:strand:- start:117 stop:296 length:180 start_codon:yes stop_codon:yes gene_type:complete